MVKSMVTGRTLVLPHKVIKVSKKLLVPDTEKNEKLDNEEVKEVKKVTQRLPANFQLGTVVATSTKKEEYKIGDVVIFKPNRCILFELEKDVIVVDDYDIIGVWSENKIN